MKTKSDTKEGEERLHNVISDCDVTCTLDWAGYDIPSPFHGDEEHMRQDADAFRGGNWRRDCLFYQLFSIVFYFHNTGILLYKLSLILSTVYKCLQTDCSFRLITYLYIFLEITQKFLYY